MEQVCLVLPVREGHADDARDFMRELEASRKPDYARSEERIGITKEVWFLAAAPAGDVLVGYMETGDFANALGLFSQSQDDFDMWFKRRMADCTGIDLNDPPTMTLPELLSNYSAPSTPSKPAHCALRNFPAARDVDRGLRAARRIYGRRAPRRHPRLCPAGAPAPQSRAREPPEERPKGVSVQSVWGT